MRLRICLDTSVFGARRDDRVPDRRTLTEEFWGRIEAFEASTSELTRREISRTREPGLRAEMLALLARVAIISLTDEMERLAERYVESGVFSPRSVEDALHVAAAVLSRQDALLSWNFRHLVNRRRRAQIQQVNALLGLPMIEILAPPEL